MSEIFRFVAVRPPQLDLPRFTLTLAFDSSPFIVTLLNARSADDPRTAMIQAAVDFQATTAFVVHPEQLVFFPVLTQLYQSVSGAEQLSLDDLDLRTRDAFGADAVTVRSNPDFPAHQRMLSDSIIAWKIASGNDPSLLDTLTRLARTLDLVARLARREPSLEITGAVAAVLAQPLVIPPTLFPLPPPKTPVPPPPDTSEDDSAQARHQEVAALTARAALVEETMGRLLAVLPDDIQKPLSSPANPRLAPRSAALTPGRFAVLLDRLLLGSRRRLPPAAGEADAESAEPEPALLRPQAIERLPVTARTLMTELGADLNQTPVTLALSRLENEGDRLGRQMARLTFTPPGRQRVRVGRTLISTRPALPAPADDLAPAGIAPTLGQVRPAGVGNLLLIRQQTLRYEPGEVAHIENVLRGELKERKTRRFRRTEETFVVERETTSEEERDLQTTERFELQEEVTKTVKSDQAFNVGVSVSAGYGPFFQVNANTGFSSATSTSDMSRRAFSYAKQVTDRSVTKLSERIRREQTIRTIEEFEETNLHNLNNVGSPDHIVGVYQWVDKITQAQIYDYGLRTFFDFIAPEPAALLLRAMQAPSGDELEEPEAFTLRPDQLSIPNYHTYVQRYHVSGVEPPPSLYRVVSRAWSEKAETFTYSLTKAEMVDLPAGYEAVEAKLVGTFGQWSADDSGNPPLSPPHLRIQIGYQQWTRRIGDPSRRTLTLDQERLSIPVSLTVFFPAWYAVNVEICCERTHRALEEWKLATHAAITQAYLKLKAEYDEKLAAAEVQAGVQIEGRNPLENRLIERAEIKKQCISLLLGQSFDAFGSIIESAQVFPHIDFDQAEVEGRNIRFFEQAFEWENMTYVYYPYYWGRKSLWLDRLLQRNVDPEHAEFLKAGAARVVVPVRPGFEHAIVHLLETGQLWNGGDLPQIGSPLYVDILEEIRARQRAPGAEVPVGEPWEIRLPTTLVRLRPDGSLPRWAQDQNGDWQPVEG